MPDILRNLFPGGVTESVVLVFDLPALEAGGQWLEVGLGFLARDRGQVTTVKAPNLSH